jgi:DNA polymerase-4
MINDEKPVRCIIHVDMDAFYASVEEKDRPELKGTPVIVGGLGPRGVVSTANYPARKFGVHSAMPMARARQLCPRANFISPRPARYREISRNVFEIFRDKTPLVEGLSLDEAFLDVTSSLRLFGSAVEIAEQIRAEIKAGTGLTASVGIAHNKFLAKMASEINKPDGLLWIRESEVQNFLDPMPIRRLWGIGRQTEPKLRALGILTIGQLRRADRSILEPVLGQRTGHFLRLACGEDERGVTVSRPDKSISHEVTFDVDLESREDLLSELQRQADRVARRLRKQHLVARTVSVKIRDGQFRTATRSRSLVEGSNSSATIYRMARALFEKWRSEHRHTPVRLLGVGTSNFETEPTPGEAPSRRDKQVDQVIDIIKDRFGEERILHAQELKRHKP